MPQPTLQVAQIEASWAAYGREDGYCCGSLAGSTFYAMPTIPCQWNHWHRLSSARPASNLISDARRASRAALSRSASAWLGQVVWKLETGFPGCRWKNVGKSLCCWELTCVASSLSLSLSLALFPSLSAALVCACLARTCLTTVT